jgi:hypothetical protein
MSHTPRAPRGLVLGVLLGCVACASPALVAFEFNLENSCVILNAENTDLENRPVACPPGWCDCARSILTNPTRGEASGVEQGVFWVVDEDGIGNQMVSTARGTLDLSGVAEGDVIGELIVNEVVPGFGVIFMTRSEVVVVGKTTDGARTILDLEILLVEVTPIVIGALQYNPFDCLHSCGLQYRARLTANGPDAGWVLEYRYEARSAPCTPPLLPPELPPATENCGENPPPFPAIEPSDTSPGFTVRFVLSLFTRDAENTYTLPAGAENVTLVTTIRRFATSGDTINNPAEILPLGTGDLCDTIAAPEPCRTFSDTIDLCASKECTNDPPVATIVVTDINLNPLFDNMVFIDCGIGQAVLRGSNSSDGDGGSQGLTYLWEVVSGPAGGAELQAEAVTLMDTNITILLPGTYTIRLTVDDGESENNIDTATVMLIAEERLGPNLPPRVTSFTWRPAGPDTAEVELLQNDEILPIITDLRGDAQPEVTDLDADADTGADGCTQAGIITWSVISQPDGSQVVFLDPLDDDTDVDFSHGGTYILQFEANDQATDGITRYQFQVTVRLPVQGVGPFKRGDCNQDGSNTGQVTDGVFLLNFLFTGGPSPQCLAACDMNGDGSVPGAPTDAVAYFNFNFLGGTPLPDPLRECALSETEGDLELGCADPEGCEGA